MPTNATTQQLLDAFEQLSFDDQLALRLYAMRQLVGTQFSEPLDLVHEALYRSLDGLRNWPLGKGVNFGLYMCLTMRSIAHDDRKSGDARSSAGQSDGWLWEHAESARGSAPSAEDEAIAFEGHRMAQAAASHARGSLEGDEDAQRVLNGMLAGMSPKEVCSSFDIGPKRYHAARERVMRRIKQYAATVH